MKNSNNVTYPHYYIFCIIKNYCILNYAVATNNSYPYYYIHINIIYNTCIHTLVINADYVHKY